MNERVVWRSGLVGLVISAIGLAVVALQMLLIWGLALGGLSGFAAA